METTSHFVSPTSGICEIDVLRSKILAYIQSNRESKYRLIIGSDSQPKNGTETDFVTAIVIHRVGAGGIYFWKRRLEKKRYVLRQRMYQEALLSLGAAEEFVSIFQKDGISKMDIEIHVDIGTGGETREMIAEIVGMIRSSGYMVKTKPDSFGASKVADRHT